MSRGDGLRAADQVHVGGGQDETLCLTRLYAAGGGQQNPLLQSPGELHVRAVLYWVSPVQLCGVALQGL